MIWNVSSPWSATGKSDERQNKLTALLYSYLVPETGTTAHGKESLLEGWSTYFDSYFKGIFSLPFLPGQRGLYSWYPGSQAVPALGCINPAVMGALWRDVCGRERALSP